MDQDKTKRTIITGQKPAEKLPLAQQMRRVPTPAEARLWTHLRAGRLRGLHFRRQQVIDGFIVDFYYHATGLAVELDSAVHQHQADYDAERTRILEERGLHIIRFTNSRVENDCPAVLREIAESATYHLASQGPP